VKALIDHSNVVFCLAIGLVVLRGGYLELNMKVFHELLSKVRGESTLSVGDNREGISVNSKFLVQKHLGSLFSINIFGDRECKGGKSHQDIDPFCLSLVVHKRSLLV
jgi:hypothetical protein